MMDKILTLLGYMQPEAAWKWPLAFGILFACLITGWVRKKAHILTYILTGAWIIWLISKFVPLMATIIDNTWGRLMNFHLPHDFAHKTGIETVREATVGLVGCFILTGILGGSGISGMLGSWYNIAFIVLGVLGFVGLISFIAEKAGGKTLENKIKKAKKGSVLYYWAKIRGIGLKPKKDAHGHDDHGHESHDDHGHDDHGHESHDDHGHDDHGHESHDDHQADAEAAHTTPPAQTGIPCPRCGHRNHPQAKFCDGCTHPIASKRVRTLLKG